MVSEGIYEGETIYICDLCGLGYRDRETAGRCEEWCAAHRSCNIDITRKAIYYPKSPAELHL